MRASPGSGNTPVTVTATITGLAAGDSYHFRVVARDASEPHGADQASDTQLRRRSSASTGRTGNAAGRPGDAPGAAHEPAPVPEAELASTMLTASSSGTVGVELMSGRGEQLRRHDHAALAGRPQRSYPSAQAGEDRDADPAEGSFEVAGGHVVALTASTLGQGTRTLARIRILRGRAPIVARDSADTTDTAQAAVTIRMRTAPRGHNS